MANESCKRLWPDEDEWLDFFREHLCGHPELAEQVARIWFALLEHNSQGPDASATQGLFWTMPPRPGSDAAHLSVYPVIPAGVPALPAVSNRIRQAG
jgi:hypothetical protein